ncbi:excalibur calcium-binding protein [Streptomyces sp. NPDC085932]|uniref:excalibur calcium-binding protein n=1 Tax=Streptomyces sp. NPDC085932 TaxID=3365741 RepID=UPI0037CE97CB
MRRRTGVIGTLFAIAAIVPLSAPAHAQPDRDCRDFAFQEDAQAVFDADPRDPHRLDEDRGPDDGIACEALPRRGTGIISPTSPARPSASVSATPATTPATPVTPVTPATRTPGATTPAAATPSQGVRGGVGGAVASGPTDWDVGLGLTFAVGASLMAGYLIKRRRRR